MGNKDKIIAEAKQIKLMMQDEASYSLTAKQATTMIKIMHMPTWSSHYGGQFG